MVKNKIIWTFYDFFNLNIVDMQYCVSFRYTAEVIQLYIFILFSIISYYKILNVVPCAIA